MVWARSFLFTYLEIFLCSSICFSGISPIQIKVKVKFMMHTEIFTYDTEKLLYYNNMAIKTFKYMQKM